MPVWKNPYATPPATLKVNAEKLMLTVGEQERSWPVAELALAQELILRHFDYESYVEVEAFLKESQSPEPILHRHPLPARPSVPRYFSDNHGRGAGRYNIWLDGKTIIILVESETRLEVSHQEFLKTGFSPAAFKVIGKKTALKVMEAVTTLSRFSCFCGTGGTRSCHHHSLQTLAFDNHPYATMAHSVHVARCNVCGNGWTFTESGDSHYSYSYSIRPLPW
jgi:hypothetical protein